MECWKGCHELVHMQGKKQKKTYAWWSQWNSILVCMYQHYTGCSKTGGTSRTHFEHGQRISLHLDLVHAWITWDKKAPVESKSALINTAIVPRSSPCGRSTLITNAPGGICSVMLNMVFFLFFFMCYYFFLFWTQAHVTTVLNWLSVFVILFTAFVKCCFIFVIIVSWFLFFYLIIITIFTPNMLLLFLPSY